ncbi:MarR family transcriptional regulator [Paenibacillus xylanilyticus]|uniref:MarR family transcriptional regulator n=1 Tax=Paenibacillus xylanilyticus TaxID=248903 RepID=A0A7Y6EYP7_9BACL|nr:MarR family transcriptional regulator [Paenibacillus xylanilyticus]NUU80171.1 MarR family transcriptional regulator [Paenibacillus xylanilyticus]
MDHEQTDLRYIYGLFIKLLHQKEQKDDQENLFLMDIVRKTVSSEAALNMTDVHVIACIGEHEPINLTSIAERMELSKGNTSKVAHKLLKQGWLRKTQLNDNKKEIYFRLTSPGKKLFHVHADLHVKVENQFLRFLGQYNKMELEFLKRFVLDLTRFYEQLDTRSLIEDLEEESDPTESKI